MSVGDRIKEARKKAGLTQKQLGFKIGVSSVTITRYERGERAPSTDQLKKIASALNIPITALITDAESSRHRSVWGYALNQKLTAIGCSLGYDPDDAYLWINYPGGTIETSVDELEMLNTMTDNYLRFLLEQMGDGIRFGPRKQTFPAPGSTQGGEDENQIDTIEEV